MPLYFLWRWMCFSRHLRELHSAVCSFDGGVPLEVLCRHTALIEVLQEPPTLADAMVRRLSRGGLTIIPAPTPGVRLRCRLRCRLARAPRLLGVGPVIGLQMHVHEHVGEPLLRHAVFL